MPEAATKLTPEEEKAIAAIHSAGRGPPAGSKEDAGSFGASMLNALDTATLGGAPALDDFLRKHGVIDERTAPPSMRSQLAANAELHPYASFAGRAGGMMLPFAGAARVAQAALPAAGSLAVGALGAGGANVADQAVRSQTEDREFSTGEAALAAGLGGAGPMLFHPIKALGGMALGAGKNAILGAAESALAKEVPEAAAAAGVGGRAAASQTLDDAAAAGAKFRAEQAAPKPQAGPDMRPPGPGPLRPEYPGTVKGEGFTMRPAPEPPPVDPLRPRSFEGGGGKPFSETTPEPPAAPDPAKVVPPPRKPYLGEPGSAGPPPGAPFAGVRPGKLEQGSPLWEELSARLRGEPKTPPPSAAPPPPPAPLPPSEPGLLDGIPLRKLGYASAATSGEQTRKNAVEEQKRRRKKR